MASDAKGLARAIVKAIGPWTSQKHVLVDDLLSSLGAGLAFMKLVVDYWMMGKGELRADLVRVNPFGKLKY